MHRNLIKQSGYLKPAVHETSAAPIGVADIEEGLPPDIPPGVLAEDVDDPVADEGGGVTVRGMTNTFSMSHSGARVESVSPLDEEHLFPLNLPLVPVDLPLGHLHQLDVLGYLLDPSMLPLLEPTPTRSGRLIVPSAPRLRRFSAVCTPNRLLFSLFKMGLAYAFWMNKV